MKIKNIGLKIFIIAVLLIYIVSPIDFIPLNEIDDSIASIIMTLIITE